jgi:GTPase
MTPTIAIVGRPNVGKSTLFNRLVGKKLALVDDRPGVTRDRREGEARLGDLEFRVVDTAGLEEADEGSLLGRMRAQTEAAIDDARLILFVIDARVGILPADRPFAEMVRRSGKPVILIANKAEGGAGMAGAYDAFSLGLGDPIPLSAEHGEGLADLFEALMPHFPDPTLEDGGDEEGAGEGFDSEQEFQDDPTKPLQVAIVGRPNAGKSTLINRMLGEDRLLVGPEAGITRDSISIDWRWRGRPVRLFDTAGLRKRARIDDKLEKLSVADALRAVKFAEIVVVLLDATIPFEKQDLSIVDLVETEGRALVIGVNKWDLVAD